MARRSPIRSIAVAALLAGVALLYAPTLRFEFLSFDDPVYVTANRHVTAGLTTDGVRWAFTAGEGGNWHPLTWLSHMLDVRWFGLEPSGHHATNLALHALNAALLFLVLDALTRRPGRSFVVATLFALHPIQVESVAWVAERKNLLSTSFGLLALGAYASYARHGGAWRWAALAGAMAASLMAKAMLVTLPFVLLLLDVWPLERTRTTPLRRLLLEKLPLLLLSGAASVVAYHAQADVGAMASSGDLPWAARLAYAPIAYLRHLGHLFWPSGLAVLYPHPLLADGARLAATQVALALLALAVPSALALFASRRGQRAALIGWLFFLGTLVPVIGVVQVGSQALADRYAYLPMIGILVALTWGGADLLGAALDEPRRRSAAWLATAVVCVLLAFSARSQLTPWRSSKPLFLRAIAVTGPNPIMHRELGLLLTQAGDYASALPHLEQAAALAPGWGLAQRDLGAVLSKLGHPEQALAHLESGVALGPERADARAALGAALLQLGRADEACEQLEQAVRLEPSAAFLALLADAQARSGRLDAAIASQQRALAAAEATHSPESARLRARLETFARQRAESGAPSSNAASAAAEGAARPQLVAPPRGARRPARRVP
jgi:tetratricopeptide (TPR) repeat protein